MSSPYRVVMSSSPSVEFKRRYSRSKSAREGDKIKAGGVRITSRNWKDASVRVPDKYASKLAAPLNRVQNQQVFQLEVREEKKSYAYRLHKIDRGDHMEYTLRSCYGDFRASRDIYIFEPDGRGSTSYYYGDMQNEIKSTHINIYWVDDNYLLGQLGKEELAVSNFI